MSNNNDFEFARQRGLFVARFHAMASPCEVLIDGEDQHSALRAARAAVKEVRRIEAKFSRYRRDNLVHAINHADGCPRRLDAETRRLLEYAAELYRLSDGLFDLSSGVLRQVWRFDGEAFEPDRELIARLLPTIGFDQLRVDGDKLTMPAGMQLDFGGIGKEYAVDKALNAAQAKTPQPILVNLGGDLRCSGPRAHQQPWRVGVDTQGFGLAEKVILIESGALATSGDANRYVLVDGMRLPHVLNPKTGWPVEAAPAAVTVAALTCTVAGSLSTLALLKGEAAEAYLEAQQVMHWVMRRS